MPGSVAWRTRVIDGRAYMTAYRGGENLYRFHWHPLRVDLLTSQDRRSWQALDPKRRAI